MASLEDEYVDVVVTPAADISQYERDLAHRVMSYSNFEAEVLIPLEDDEHDDT